MLSRALTALAALLTVLVYICGGIQYFLADRTKEGILISGTPISYLFLPLLLTMIAALARRCRAALALSMLGCVTLAAVCGLQIRPISKEPADFTVATYNIEHGLKGLDKVVAAIRELDPDIALLQEATMKWEPEGRTLEEFEAKFPDCAYAFSEDRIVLSKYPILDARFEWLGPRKSRKRVQLATLEVSGRKVTVANVHMLPAGGRSTWDWITAHRAQEYKDLFRTLTRLQGPVVLGGDFNGIAHGPNYAKLRETMVDAFAASGQGFGFTVPTELPMRRIDMLFTTAELAPVRCWVGPQTASDHRPVLAEFRWADRKVPSR